MANELNIVQGDQYAIPFPIFVGGVPATPDNVTGIRIKLDDTLKAWPDGGLSYDSARGVWCYPVTETQTRSWGADSRIDAQVGVAVGGNDFHYTHTFFVQVGKNIITEEWGV